MFVDLLIFAVGLLLGGILGIGVGLYLLAGKLKDQLMLSSPAMPSEDDEGNLGIDDIMGEMMDEIGEGFEETEDEDDER